jgi:predicted DCC family thiol-disulfide oxidoreductase YuxK
MADVEPAISHAKLAENAARATLESRPTEAAHPVIFFDGVCGLCNRFVDFVIRRDPNGVFHFSTLQGEAAAERLDKADVRDLKTVVVVDSTGTHRKSAAVLSVLRRLGGFWGLAASALWLVPRPLRDLGYTWIASKRYAIFGKKETCRLPTATERARFLS